MLPIVLESLDGIGGYELFAAFAEVEERGKHINGIPAFGLLAKGSAAARAGDASSPADLLVCRCVDGFGVLNPRLASKKISGLIHQPVHPPSEKLLPGGMPLPPTRAFTAPIHTRGRLLRRIHWSLGSTHYVEGICCRH